MAASKLLQAGAKADPGSVVTVAMDVNRKERVVAVPLELKRALVKSKKAARAFDALSYSHRKQFADWVAGAKLPATRVRRAQEAIPLVLAKTHPI